ncbi:hypothetical protein BH10ACT3_BH10ACT3_08680 [soil metagenome]
MGADSDPLGLVTVRSSPALQSTYDLIVSGGAPGARVVCHGDGPYRHCMTTHAPGDDVVPSSPLRVVLLVAHGSRNPLAAVEHTRLCGAVQEDLRSQPAEGASQIQVRPAYLEIAEPSIQDAVDAAVADGATSIRLLPHFLNSGNHVMVDLPAQVAAATERHPEIAIELVEHLGADPGLVRLLTTRALAD